MKKRITLSCCMAITLILSSQVAVAKIVNAVASFSVLADIVSQVGGEHVKVTALVGDNSDPHAFEPAPKDSQALVKADVVFVSGLGFDGWIDRLVTASGYNKGKLITASAGVNIQKIDKNGQTITDPHAWNSMHNGVIYARNVMNALITANCQDAGYFRQRGEAYIQLLEKLDSWAKKQFADIPQEKRKVLTSHEAFGYFGAEYGVHFLAPVGFSTETESSASNVAQLIDQLKYEQVKTYFIENQTDQRLVKQIASASSSQLGGELYPEGLSNINGPASTYVEAFCYNVTIVVDSLK
ncbi:metal ABC transporter solute-binding protein, Zn/Mn family [Candidatus Hoaglandella endobia]|uniref:Manganese ABC transporter substrate-binding lipoprotein n=1 Tax=Candidatus Hoaglandella endobia TaxID=1778263 RepID=A0A143WTE6_9ENTR|nr:zinc ABC transporter substrate-binding protein [Candidatus Hoaglandella endobia]CUX97017.1 Manganese ABC transporter substrate-binding lipoprotein precursor [Candidatus Hoaglandella endobia]